MKYEFISNSPDDRDTVIIGHKVQSLNYFLA